MDHAFGGEVAMRRVLFSGTVLLLATLMVPGCSWFGAHKEKPDTEPSSVPVTAPDSSKIADKALPEAEVKPEPVVALPAAAPPPVPPAPVAPGPETVRPASPAEQTKEALGPKPAQTAALTPPRTVQEPSSEAATAEPPGQPGSKTSVAKAPESQAKPEGAKAGQVKAPGRSIAVVGDSLAVGIGMTMENNIKQYEGMGCFPLGKVSTGLIAKHFFDWEKRLTELVAKEKLAAVVVMMGGNDANNPIAGKAAGTPEWGAAYRRKAEDFLGIAAKAGVKVLWVGLPAMRDPAYAARVRAVNDAAREACAAVAGCVYMEAGDAFVDASGKYVQAKNIGGKTVALRAKDGVHMTMTGYDLLCRRVLDHLGQAGELPARVQ
jgi:uncharacterized protein